MTNPTSHNTSWIGPAPRAGEPYARYQMRWAAYSFAWLCLFSCVLATSFLIVDRLENSETSIFGLIFVFMLAEGMALLATIGFLLKACKSQFFGPNPILTAIPVSNIPGATDASASTAPELISLQETFFERSVAAIITLLLMGLFGFAITQEPLNPIHIGLWLWLAFAFFALLRDSRNRLTVWLHGNELIAANRLGEERIPLSLVNSVTESRFSRGKVVAVTWMKAPDALEKIVFLVAWDARQRPFADHPIVKRLRLLMKP